MFLDYVSFENVRISVQFQISSFQSISFQNEIEINPISLWSEINQTPEISDVNSDFALEWNCLKFRCSYL